MFKKIMMTTFIVTTLILSGSVWAQPADIEETVDKAAVAKAKMIRERALRLKEKATSDTQKKKVDRLLTKAADMETNAHKLGNKCKHGSHFSIATVQQNHKNCEACHEVDIPDGECVRVPGDHKHYYCYCDC